ncbi:MAG: hypothetical protein QW551_07065 [Desulfurococcaceae archaeon]
MYIVSQASTMVQCILVTSVMAIIAKYVAIAVIYPGFSRVK